MFDACLRRVGGGGENRVPLNSRQIGRAGFKTAPGAHEGTICGDGELEPR